MITIFVENLLCAKWKNKKPASFSGPFYNKRNRGSLGKWLILGLGQEKCKISLGHHIVTEREKRKRKKEEDEED